MPRLDSFVTDTFAAVSRLFGYDCFIESSRGSALTDGRAIEFLPAFGSVRIRDGVEAWGLGCHLVISRVRVVAPCASPGRA